MLVVVLLLALSAGTPLAQDKPIPQSELNTILMESTFRIHGPKKGDASKSSFGTVFLIGKPSPDASKAYYVLVSAAHVFEDIEGENGTLTLREKHSDGSYTQKFWSVKLRDKDATLYVKHRDLDVAALLR